LTNQREKLTSLQLTQSGVVALKQKGEETNVSHFSEYQPAVVIKVLNVLVPALER